MSTIVSNYNQTVVAAPTAPSTESVFDYELNFPLYREIVKRDLVDEPKMRMELTSAKSFFNGESMIDASTLLGNLKYGQELIVNILKDQNPFSLFQKEALEYAPNENDSCHSHVVLNCEMPCINTLPTFEQLRFRFDCEYVYGVRMCDKNRDFWNTEFFTKQYALSRRACEFGQEVDLWNTIIDGLVASPATTVDAAVAAVHPTHFWANQGAVATNARCVIPEAVWYLRQSFANINPTVFISSEFATELIRSVETAFGLNNTAQRVNTFEQWIYPGYRMADRVKEILGIDVPVVVLERSPWMTVGNAGSGSGATTFSTQYPLWSADGESQYVAILDPRVGYQFEKDGYHLNIRPYDCDKLYAGMIDSKYTGSGITFPTLGLVIEFEAFSYC